MWDNAGNLVEKQTKTHTFTYRYNDANQLLEMKGHRLPGFSCDYAQCEDDEYSDSQWFNYQYDANGYLTEVSNNTEQQTYQHDALGRMTHISNPDGTAVTYGYDARSRRVMIERTLGAEAEPQTQTNNGKGKGQTGSSSVTQSGVITLYSHYDGRQEQGQWQQAGNGFEVFRSLTLLPQANLPYAQVLHQSLSDSKSQLVKASGTKGADASNLYVHHDNLGSAIQVLDGNGTQAMRLGYNPFGQVYRKHNDKTQWKINAGVNANKQLGQLMPYQYTGGYTDGNTGLVHLDARWYNPHTSRFVQPDYWNFKNTYLPTEIQHELMRFTGLNVTAQLMRDPNQQLAYGDVSGNPLVWVDPFGLASCPTEQKPEYKQYRLDPSTGELIQIDIVRQQVFDARPQDASGILATAAGADSISAYETTTKKEYANALAIGSLVVGGTPGLIMGGITATVSYTESQDPDDFVETAVEIGTAVGGKYLKGVEPLFESLDNLNKINTVREVLDDE